MKTIINSKNALCLLFLIPILTTAISFVIPSDINYKIPTAIYLCCYLILGLSCCYLAYSPNEFIVNRKQKASMYILAIDYLIFDCLINRFLSLISENYKIYAIVSNICADETMTLTYTSLVYAFFGIFFWVGFLMFIWGIPTKKSQRWLLTLVLFTPYIVDIICPFFKIETYYRHMIVDTLQIASYGTMLYLTLKAYKAKVITD